MPGAGTPVDQASRMTPRALLPLRALSRSTYRCVSSLSRVRRARPRARYGSTANSLATAAGCARQWPGSKAGRSWRQANRRRTCYGSADSPPSASPAGPPSSMTSGSVSGSLGLGSTTGPSASCSGTSISRPVRPRPGVWPRRALSLPAGRPGRRACPAMHRDCHNQTVRVSYDQRLPESGHRPKPPARAVAPRVSADGP
jgi:hypothetical protein